jgi:small basic protein (TIGR04137 family)
MSIDRSLKGANMLVRHRNVLNRGERLLKLQEMEKWSEGKSVYNLPKVGHRKAVLAKTAKAEAAADGAATPAAGAAAAAPAAKAPAGKAAPAAKAAPKK